MQSSQFPSVLQKILFLPYKVFVNKQNIYAQYTSVFFIWLAVIWHITITLLQSLITLRLPIHPSRGAHCCSSKVFLNFRKHLHKIAGLKTFGNFPVKHPWWCPFQLPLQVFLGISKNILFCKELSACFCKKKLYSRHTLSSFPE